MHRVSVLSASILMVTPGVIEIECYDHQPSMRGEILVLAE
jgi:hypothetical protein